MAISHVPSQGHLRQLILHLYLASNKALLGELREATAKQGICQPPSQAAATTSPSSWGLGPPKVCVVGSPQQYEAMSCSVSAKHPPTAQSHSLLHPQSQVHHCLFNLTTKFCQSHHPAVNNEGHLQPSFLKGSSDKQCVQQFPAGTGQSEACSPEAAPGEGRGEGARGLALPHHSLLLPLPSLCTANRRTVLPSCLSPVTPKAIKCLPDGILL